MVMVKFKFIGELLDELFSSLARCETSFFLFLSFHVIIFFFISLFVEIAEKNLYHNLPDDCRTAIAIVSVQAHLLIGKTATSASTQRQYCIFMMSSIYFRFLSLSSSRFFMYIRHRTVLFYFIVTILLRITCQKRRNL
jgi:hypothetical protein